MEWLYVLVASLGFLWLAVALLQKQLSYSHGWMRKSGGRSAGAAVLPPGPPVRLPILGHLLNVAKEAKTLHRYLAGLARTYGPIVFLRLGSVPTIVISSPQLAKEFLHTHDIAFADRPLFTSSAFLGGIEGRRSIALIPYGDEWKQGRKLYSLQLFTSQRIQELLSDVVSHEIHRLISHRLLLWNQQPLAAADRTAVTVNLTECFQSFMENIICQGLLGQHPSQLIVMDKSTSQVSLSQLLQDLSRLLLTPMLSDFVPWLGFMDYKVKASMKKWRSSFTVVVDHILNHHKRTNTTQDQDDQNDDVTPTHDQHRKSRDIVDVFLLPHNNLSRDLIQVRISELLSGGIETSSITLDWAMAELLANPHVLAKLRAELDQAVGRERFVEQSDIPQLPYLQAVVKETFRKHPPLPLIPRAMHSETCTVGGYKIPKGTRLFVNAWAIGHDPEVWKDPEVFMPERFLEAGAKQVDVKGHHFELLPFGAGRRICPGMGMGLGIVQLTLATLVHSLEWELPPLGHHHHEEKGIKMDMSDELGLMCHRVQPLLVLPPKSRLTTTSLS